MIQISDNEERLDIVYPMPVGTRFLFALLALFPLLAPYELVLRVRLRASRRRRLNELRLLADREDESRSPERP